MWMSSLRRLASHVWPFTLIVLSRFTALVGARWNIDQMHKTEGYFPFWNRWGELAYAFRSTSQVEPLGWQGHISKLFLFAVKSERVCWNIHKSYITMSFFLRKQKRQVDKSYCLEWFQRQASCSCFKATEFPYPMMWRLRNWGVLPRFFQSFLDLLMTLILLIAFRDDLSISDYCKCFCLRFFIGAARSCEKPCTPVFDGILARCVVFVWIHIRTSIRMACIRRDIATQS